MAQAMIPVIGEHHEEILAWLRSVARPPAGLEVRTLDGATYSGVIVVDHNRVVAVLASRSDVAGGPPRAAPRPAPVPEAPFPRSLFEEPPWDDGRYPFPRR